MDFLGDELRAFIDPVKQVHHETRDTLMFQLVLSVCWFKDKQVKIMKRSLIPLSGSF